MITELIPQWIKVFIRPQTNFWLRPWHIVLLLLADAGVCSEI